VEDLKRTVKKIRKKRGSGKGEGTVFITKWFVSFDAK
jgi:hypothetical protein